MPELLSFGAVSSPTRKVMEITSFAGIDLSSAPSDIDMKRSPNAPNMMPDAIGNPIKRTGYKLSGEFPGRINGAFILGGHEIIHAGTGLFIDGEEAWNGMNDERSSGQIIGERLYIFDGLLPMVTDGESAWPLEDGAYIPTVLISKNADFRNETEDFTGDGTSTEFSLEHEPEEILSVTVDETSTAYSEEGGKITFETAPAEGVKILVEMKIAAEPGGSALENFNLLSPRWRESFLCSTGTETEFTLSKTELSEAPVFAKILGEDGEWTEKTEGEDFSVDREKGKITFAAAVPKTPVTGEDNLIIEAEKYFSGNAEKIALCRRSITFDKSGTSTRIFASGNPEFPGRDFFCAADDPTFWPENNWSEIGSGESEIVGYSVMEDLLCAYLSNPKDGRSIVLRSPDMDDRGNVSFPVIKHLQGEEAVCPKGFVFMENEQLFLTAKGVYAITAADVTGEKYTQNRSYFINRALCSEDLAEAFCGKWKQFFCIAAGGKIYLLDSSQRSYQRGEPLSSSQYECYLWTGIDARILWEKDGKLFFGDSEGRTFFFAPDFEAAVSYSDWSPEGEKEIEAFWTVPDFSGETFWRNKTIRTVALSLAPYPQNRVVLEKCVNGEWEAVREWEGKISFFAWNAVDWANFSWSGNRNYRTVTAKVKIKKFDKVGFRIGCSGIGKAFGLYGFSAEYVESGRYKK